MTVVGYRRTQFTPKDGNEEIRGFSIYLTAEDENVTGLMTDRIFVSDKKLGGYEPSLDDEIRILYNRYGSVDTVELVG